MRSIVLALPFIALTALCWGNYGPLMHHGQHHMGNSSLRPFMCVGLAYFLIAVVVPLVVLRLKGEGGKWTLRGTCWSLLAGSAGAVGALGIVMAFKFRGNPIYVMPLVFGLAPVVNTFVTMGMARTYKEASLIFYAGVVIVAIGASGVLFFKPATRVQVSEAGGKISVVETNADNSKQEWTFDDERELHANEKVFAKYRRFKPLNASEWIYVLLSIGLTALCWGAYGPVLHSGQMKMSGSRLRPFLCVGLAYFAIAVVVPYLLLTARSEPGNWDAWGVVWSLGAGAAGAIGALGIIMAFNFGGKPIFVMPLVFGGAPVINTFTTILEQGNFGRMTAPFYGSLLMVIGGAVTVLVFSPKPHHKPVAKDKAAAGKAATGKAAAEMGTTEKVASKK